MALPGDPEATFCLHKCFLAPKPHGKKKKEKNNDIKPNREENI